MYGAQFLGQEGHYIPSPSLTQATSPAATGFSSILSSASGAAVLLTGRTLSGLRTPRSSIAEEAFSHLPYVDFPVNINQFLWRGASLSNTEWVIGIVVYTGHNTRIFKNTKCRVLKYSKLLKTYNKHAIVLACTQVSHHAPI